MGFFKNIGQEIKQFSSIYEFGGNSDIGVSVGDICYVEGLGGEIFQCRDAKDFDDVGSCWCDHCIFNNVKLSNGKNACTCLCCESTERSDGVEMIFVKI